MPLSLINQINVYHLKIFESVYRLQSMSLSAQELHLTQSGVSQHIIHFEKSLGIPLFIRSQKKIFPTEVAHLLYQTCQQSFQEIENTLEVIKSPQSQQLEGTIRIGFPTEFGTNIAIPFIAEWGKRFKKIKFDFIYGYGPSFIQQLENDQIDLAFIDSMPTKKGVNSHIVFQETLNLVATKDYLKNARFTIESYKNMLSLDYIEYEHKESIVRNWFHHNYNKKNVPLEVKAWVSGVQGVANLVKQGLGVGILPNHRIQKLVEQGISLHLFSGRKAQMKNDISVAWSAHKTQNQVCAELLKYILNNNQLK